jgi:hypothetical protein
MSVVRSRVTPLVGILVLCASAMATAAIRPRATSGRAHEPFVAPPVRVGTVVLYDQYDNPAAFDVTSQDFEVGFDTFDSQGADDFAVPAGQTWSIEGVDVDGTYNGGPAASFNVFFYVNSGTLPGVLVCSRPANPFTVGPAAGDAVITLTSPCALPPGTYWVSVQARQDFATAGQWFWQNRSVPSFNPAAWQNPGGGWGAGCPTWNVRTTCLPVLTGPDQVYRLNGIIVPVDLQGFTVED